jgi:hypothetical protein
MSQEPLEAAPTRRALRALQADAGQVAAAQTVAPPAPDERAPRLSRRELRAQAAASLWSQPAEQWVGHAEQWVEQTGSWAVQEPAPEREPALEPEPATHLDPEPQWSVPVLDAEPQWSVPVLDAEPQWSVPVLDAEPQWSVPVLDAEPQCSVPVLDAEPQWSVPEPARAEQWADQAEQWSVPEPAPAERWRDLEPADDAPLESGSLIMPAGHASTGPVTPAQPYGQPAVFLDAPVQPALPPLDRLEVEPDPVRARVDLAEPAVVPAPRVAPAVEAPRAGSGHGAADAVALRALALAEALSSVEKASVEKASVETASPVGTSAREEELAYPLGELTLAERLASLPVAPWAVDLEVLEGGYVEHPCEPVDSVPHPHEPVVETVPPAAPGRAPERARDLSLGTSPARPTAQSSDRSASTADAPPARSAERPLPRANEHIPTVGAWVPPSHDVDPLTAMRRQPGPPLATWGAWLGVAAAVAWFLGPVALGIGVWSMNVARQHDYSRARPLTAIVGGVIGTLMGIAFVVAWR